MTTEFLTVEMLDTVAREWNGAFLPADSSEPHAWIEWQQDDSLILQIRNWLYAMSPTYDGSWPIQCAMDRVMNAYQPTPSREKGSLLIVYYESRSKYDRGIRTQIKPGKFFRKILRGAPDTFIQELDDRYRRAYDLTQFRVVIGQTREEFRFAGEERNFAEYQNPNTNSWRKNLGQSCMRHDFFRARFGANPLESYASGDFRVVTVVTAEGKEGKLAARSVVCIAKRGVVLESPLHAPVYGVSDAAIDTCESALAEMGAKRADMYGSNNGADWEGARLLRIETTCGDGIIFPYLDCEPHYAKDCEDWLILSDRGELERTTEGWQSCEERAECYSCEDSFDLDDLYEVNGYHYCESCRSDQFEYCQECNEWHSDDSTSVYYRVFSWGAPQSRGVCESCLSDNYTQCKNGDYWHNDRLADAVTEDEECIPQYFLDNGTWFVSDESGIAYPANERAECENGDTLSVSEAEDRGMVRNAWGRWADPEDVVTTGRIEDERQGELPLDAPERSSRLFAVFLACPAPSELVESFIQSECGIPSREVYILPLCNCPICQSVRWLRTGSTEIAAAVAAE